MVNFGVGDDTVHKGEADGAEHPALFEGLHETVPELPEPASVVTYDAMKPLYNRELLADPSH